MGEELRQRLGRDIFRFGIDRAAKGLERNAASEDLLASGGIHRHSAVRIVEKPRKLAAPHVMHPVRDHMFVRQPF